MSLYHDDLIVLQLRASFTSQFFVIKGLNRGPYMSTHVLLNLLNKLRKRGKRRGFPSVLSLFRNEFNKFNKTRSQMLDSIYLMTLRIL